MIRELQTVACIALMYLILTLSLLWPGVARAQGKSIEIQPSTAQTITSHIESTPIGRYEAVLTYTYFAADEHARYWLVVAPSPPALPSQSDISIGLSPVDNVGYNTQEASDASLEGRPLVEIEVPVQTPDLATGLTVRWVCQATLYRRNIEPGPPTTPVPALSSSERDCYLATTPTIDYSTDSFRRWLYDNSLLRRFPQESDIVFARRAFDFLCNNGTYDYTPDQDRAASKICEGLRTDCGGFSYLYCAILRANDIPARALVGRHATSGTGPDDGTALDSGQTHVKAEFYAAGIGWVPVDVSGSLGYKKSRFEPLFGVDDGKFITMEVDPDITIYTYKFGYKTLRQMQNLVQWAVGRGSFDGARSSSTWQVAPAAASGGA